MNLFSAKIQKIPLKGTKFSKNVPSKGTKIAKNIPFKGISTR